MTRGKFITFEGAEGVGKSTQIALLKEKLENQGISLVVSREPGGTAGGKLIRELLLKGDVSRWTAKTEALLMAADRAQHVEELVRPNLESGTWMILDRYYDSSIAYQGAGRGIGIEKVRALQEFATDGLRPDLTILLDMDLDVSLKRALSREGDNSDAEDRFERMDKSFHQTLKQTFLDLASKEQDRFKVVDAGRNIEVIADDIWSIVQKRFELSS
ncbi:dTMP kinase [Kordiimonas sp. SCSIO 12610]|uniref:dTMP kinase n=1 Tax=Kordiimonas sp. SCSIO 12610 TaxID=2829597 RepID=UPI00210BFA40|nr:dTMP kinase [Kordiimonas sp. SCSIO 12610]UTW53937.1 dTMP kinase [Kordiimonas sp. SCSIO 12610]